MEIITHRGFWNLKKDQNNIKALLKSDEIMELSLMLEILIQI